MDPVVVSETVAAWLASGAGKELAEGAGGGLAAAAIDRIRRAFGKDRRSLQALEAASSGGSPVSVEELAAALHWYAQDDPDFARELEGWANQASPEIRQQVKANRGSIAAGRDQTLHVGGTGGNAPGASGGGGGVMGSGTGGPGGPVGRIDLSGTDGAAPGAGGGAAGSISPASLIFQGNALSPTEGISDFLGFDGQPGGDTTVGPDDKGRIVRARGGQAGLAGSGKRTKSELISLSATVFANSIEVRNGLAFMLGGGWETYSFLNFPVDVHVPILLIVEAGGAPKGEYTIRVEVRNPYDDISASVQFGYGISKAGDILRNAISFGVNLTVTDPGVWTFVVLHEDRQLGHVPLYFKRGLQPPTKLLPIVAGLPGTTVPVCYFSGLLSAGWV